jgi:hypothetical protein
MLLHIPLRGIFYLNSKSLGDTTMGNIEIHIFGLKKAASQRK